MDGIVIRQVTIGETCKVIAGMCVSKIRGFARSSIIVIKGATQYLANPWSIKTLKIAWKIRIRQPHRLETSLEFGYPKWQFTGEFGGNRGNAG